MLSVRSLPWPPTSSWNENEGAHVRRNARPRSALLAASHRYISTRPHAQQRVMRSPFRCSAETPSRLGRMGRLAIDILWPDADRVEWGRSARPSSKGLRCADGELGRDHDRAHHCGGERAPPRRGPDGILAHPSSPANRLGGRGWPVALPIRSPRRRRPKGEPDAHVRQRQSPPTRCAQDGRRSLAGGGPPRVGATRPRPGTRREPGSPTP
jgi:hypothetical protein